MRPRKAAIAVFIAAGSAALALVYTPTIRVHAAPADDPLGQGVKAMTDAFSLIEKNFADPVSSERAFYEGAIPGMLRTLDPHSNFLDPNEFRDMQRRQHAQYFGVGME